VTPVVRWLGSRQADIAGKTMAAVALLLSLGIGVVQLRLTQCQARYAEVSNASQRARAEAAEQDRRAQDAMFDAIADQPRQAVTAVRAYRDLRRAADAQRAQNPIPPAPSTNCG
jgi:hypothetical protein